MDKKKAYNEGCAAFALGRETVKKLEEARKWGIADIFGGGIIASKNKLDRIKEAEGYLVEFKLQLSRFKEACKGIKLSDESLRVDLSNQKYESLLDNIEIDCMDFAMEFGGDIHTQRMIKKTRDEIVGICGNLKDILDELA